MENKKIFKVLIVSLVFFGAMVGATSLYFREGFDDLGRIFRADIPGRLPEPTTTYTLTVRATREGGSEQLRVRIEKRSGLSCPENPIHTTYICSLKAESLNVVYVAPEVFDGSNFREWRGPCARNPGEAKEMCRYSSGSKLNGEITAVYASKTTTTPVVSNTLHINSVPDGLSIGGIITNGSMPPDSNTINRTLTAPETHTANSNMVFDDWKGCDPTPGSDRRTCSVTVSGGVTKTITAYYKAKTSPPSGSAELVVAGLVNRAPTSGIRITADPAKFGGTTPIELEEVGGSINAVLTAPESHQGLPFKGWECPGASGRQCTVSISQGQRLEVAVYYEEASPPPTGQATLRVYGEVNNSVRSVQIDSNVAELRGGTPKTFTNNELIDAQITAADQNGGFPFSNWEGCDRQDRGERACYIRVAVGENKIVVAQYGPDASSSEPNNLTVKSMVNRATPSRGVMVEQRLPSDGAVRKETDYSILENRSPVFILDAPHAHPADGSVSFTHWEGCSPSEVQEPRRCVINFTGGQTKTVTVHYATVSLSCHEEKQSEIILSYRTPDNSFTLFRENDDGTGRSLTNTRSGENTHSNKGLLSDKEYKYHLVKGRSFDLANVVASATCRTLARDDNGGSGGGTGRPDDDDQGNLLGIKFPNPLKHTSLMKLFNHLIRLLFWLGLSGMSLIVIIGSFQMIFSGGDPAKFARGQRTIMYGAIGLVIILLSWTIVAIIRSSLTPG